MTETDFSPNECWSGRATWKTVSPSCAKIGARNRFTIFSNRPQGNGNSNRPCCRITSQPARPSMLRTSEELSQLHGRMRRAKAERTA